MEVVHKTVDEIWGKYDVDGNGSLDKDETRKFVNEVMADLGETSAIDETAFEATFATLDVAGSGRIAKIEMVHFIKKMLP